MLERCHQEAVKDFLKLGALRPTRPNVDQLGRLMRAFMRFPYENLTKIIRANEVSDPIERLRQPDIIMGDHLDLGTGGTCFSLTHFFKAILERCGYSCEPVLCDRSYGPDTHCALVATIDGARYLVDPGYLLEHPLAMPARGTSSLATPFNTVHLTRLGETTQYLLSTEQGGKTALRYRLKDRPVAQQEFLEKWIDSFGWAQMRHVCITRLQRDGHIYVRDSHLRHSTADRKSKEKIRTGYEVTIEQIFGIKSHIVDNARSYL
jgi:arylamine N-acetyltransferase